MIVRVVSFDPLKVEVDNAEISMQESSYDDEDGESRNVKYILTSKGKIPIQHQATLLIFLAGTNLDGAIEKVAIERGKKEKDKEKENPK